jgi:hypothetical protein
MEEGLQMLEPLPSSNQLMALGLKAALEAVIRF